MSVVKMEVKWLLFLSSALLSQLENKSGKKKKTTEKFTKVAGYKINMKKANSFTMYNK